VVRTTENFRFGWKIVVMRTDIFSGWMENCCKGGFYGTRTTQPQIYALIPGLKISVRISEKLTLDGKHCGKDN